MIAWVLIGLIVCVAVIVFCLGFAAGRLSIEDHRDHESERLAALNEVMRRDPYGGEVVPVIHHRPAESGS